MSAEHISFKNAKRIAVYNWKLYVAAVTGITIGLFIIFFFPVHYFFQWIIFAGILVAVWFSIASFLTFHLMFDRSGLLEGEWLKKEFNKPPQQWVEINAGLDETTIPLHSVFPDTFGKIFDIYDPETMTEPALQKARKNNNLVSTKFTALPVEDNQAELVLIMLAAHEIRDRKAREKFFMELTRITSPTGKLILVEHLRDLPATLVFGPAVFHFLPRNEWTSLTFQSNLRIEKEYSITPFIRVFILQKN